MDMDVVYGLRARLAVRSPLLSKWKPLCSGALWTYCEGSPLRYPDVLDIA